MVSIIVCLFLDFYSSTASIITFCDNQGAIKKCSLYHLINYVGIGKPTLIYISSNHRLEDPSLSNMNGFMVTQERNRGYQMIWRNKTNPVTKSTMCGVTTWLP